MKIKVYIERDEKEVEIDLKGKTVGDLLKELKIEPSRVVVVKNGEIVLEDEELSEGDYVKILDAVSGG